MTPFLGLRILALAALAPCLAPAQAPPSQAAPEAEAVTSNGFRTRMFVIQYGVPHQLGTVLRPLTSGFKGALLDAVDQDGLRTITVRDFPENLAVIEEAIKRLDVPPAAKKEVELFIDVIMASRQEWAGGAFTEDMKKVLASLKSTLNYRSFEPVASFVQRVTVGSTDLHGAGSGEVHNMAPKGEATAIMGISWKFDALRGDFPSDGLANLHLIRFNLEGRGLDGFGKATGVTIQTNLSLKDGETVVVGTSTIKDLGLIVVVKAKVLN